MVRNDRLKKTGESTKLIAEFVEERRRAKSLTQKQIASALGEKTSQSYVSVRLRGKLHGRWMTLMPLHLSLILTMPSN